MNAVKKISLYVLIAAIVALALWGFARILSASLDKSEVVSCVQWEDWAQSFKPHFFLLKWQDEMCRVHGIVIDAPIRE